jgi:hypothetical protein
VAPPVAKKLSQRQQRRLAQQQKAEPPKPQPKKEPKRWNVQPKPAPTAPAKSFADIQAEQSGTSGKRSQWNTVDAPAAKSPAQIQQEEQDAKEMELIMLQI